MSTFLIILMEVMVLLTAGLVGWSVVTSLRKRGKSGKVVNNIPVKKLSYGVAAALACLLLLTFLMADTAPLPINGKPYTDTLWLRVTGMFTATAIILMILAAALIIYGKLKEYRQNRQA